MVLCEGFSSLCLSPEEIVATNWGSLMNRGGHPLSMLHVECLIWRWWQHWQVTANSFWGRWGKAESASVRGFQIEGLVWARASVCDIMTSSEKGEQFALAADDSARAEARRSWEETGEAGDTSPEGTYVMQYCGWTVMESHGRFSNRDMWHSLWKWK